MTHLTKTEDKSNFFLRCLKINLVNNLQRHEYYFLFISYNFRYTPQRLHFTGHAYFSPSVQPTHAITLIFLFLDFRVLYCKKFPDSVYECYFLLYINVQTETNERCRRGTATKKGLVEHKEKEDTNCPLLVVVVHYSENN